MPLPGGRKIHECEYPTSRAIVAEVVAGQLVFQSLEKFGPCPPICKLELGRYRRVEASTVEAKIGTFVVGELFFLGDYIAPQRLLAELVREEVPHLRLFLHKKEDLSYAFVSVLKVIFEVEEAQYRSVGELTVVRRRTIEVLMKLAYLRRGPYGEVCVLLRFGLGIGSQPQT